MEILVKGHERFDEALKDNFDAKRVAAQKFETWEREHTCTRTTKPKDL